MHTAIRRVRGFIHCVVLVVAWLAGDACAQTKPVKPGETPVLGAGEGFVLMAVDTPVDVYAVRMNRNGTLFGSAALRDLKAGRNFRLHVAPAGTYEWRRFQVLRKGTPS